MMEDNFIQDIISLISKKTTNFDCHLKYQEHYLNDITISVNELKNIPKDSLLTQSLSEFSDLGHEWINIDNEFIYISVISNIILGNEMIKFSIPNYYLGKLRVVKFDLEKFKEIFN